MPSFFMIGAHTDVIEAALDTDEVLKYMGACGVAMTRVSLGCPIGDDLPEEIIALYDRAKRLELDVCTIVAVYMLCITLLDSSLFRRI